MASSHFLVAVRGNYQIVSGNSAVTRVKGRCAVCHRMNIFVGEQLMESLALCRMEPKWKGSPPKGWIILALSHFVTAGSWRRSAAVLFT